MLRRIFTLVPFILVAGSAVMLMLINLSGATNDLPFLNKFYFSSVTSTEEARWTMYSLCAPVGDGKVYCSKKQAAFPYSPADNFGKGVVPETFVKNRNTFYYLLRIGYACFLLGLLFSLLSLFPVLWSCMFLGFITGFFASFVIGTAFFFTLLGAVFNTAAHGKGVAAFKKVGYTAKLGTSMMVVMWISVASLLLSWLWMVLIGLHAFQKKSAPPPAAEKDDDSDLD